MKSQMMSTISKSITTLVAVAGLFGPSDLVRYGMIPEFVARLPVVSVLGDLDEAALVEFLTQPRNALVRQYQRLFEFEDVKLEFKETPEIDRGPGD